MKRFYTQDNVGHIKYLVNYHDGVKKHLDGSDFFDIKTFRNKAKRNETNLPMTCVRLDTKNE